MFMDPAFFYIDVIVDNSIAILTRTYDDTCALEAHFTRLRYRNQPSRRESRLLKCPPVPLPIWVDSALIEISDLGFVLQ
jgi:hypothetical protein